MTIQAVAWVLEHAETANAGERCVLIALANHYSKDGDCYPNYDTLAREARLSRSGVIRAVARLEEAKLVRVERSPVAGRSRVNRYSIPGYDEWSRNATPPGQEWSRPAEEMVASAPVNGRARATRTYREPNKNRADAKNASQDKRQIAEALAVGRPNVDRPDVELHRADDVERARVKAGPVAEARARLGLPPKPKDGNQ